MLKQKQKDRINELTKKNIKGITYHQLQNLKDFTESMIEVLNYKLQIYDSVLGQFENVKEVPIVSIPFHNHSTKGIQMKDNPYNFEEKSDRKSRQFKD